MFFLKYKRENIAQWLVVSGIFFNYYLEALCILLAGILLIKSHDKIWINKKLWYLGLYILLSSVISIAIVDYSYGKFVQQLLLLSYFIFIYSIIFKYFRYTLHSLFERYLKVSYIIAILGLLQFAIYGICNINIFEFLYHKSPNEIGHHVIRITSIMDEAGYLSVALTPSITYGIISGNFLRKRFLIIGLCFFLTFGAVSYLVLFSCIIYRVISTLSTYQRLYFSISFVVFLIIVCPSIFNHEKEAGKQPNMIDRFNDTFTGISKLEPQHFETLNLSSYSFLTNVWVAFNAPNRVTGTGLGTHEQNYIKGYKSNYPYYGLNSKDGYSLFNRVFSEFGIIGCILLGWYIIKYANKKNAINFACFFILFSFLLRGGHYVRFGLIFWFFLYYYSSQNLRKTSLNKDDNRL